MSSNNGDNDVEMMSAEAPHVQVSFFSADKTLPLGEDTVNIPATAGCEELNTLVNKLGETNTDEWKATEFDFLINRTLLRSDLLEFIDAHQLSTEGVIRVECILHEPPPVPSRDFPDADWISDVKCSSKHIFSTNYAGELSIWRVKAGKKLVTKAVSSDPLKCLDLLHIASEPHVVVGAQNQTLTLFKVEGIDGGGGGDGGKSKKSHALSLTPAITFRGHQRSIECVAANPEGSRIVSGSFDQCLKVWNTDKDDPDNTFTPPEQDKPKRSKSAAVTKTPMVTLESHREAVVGVQWNPLNDKQAVTVSWDHSIICWDLEMAGPTATLNSNKAFTSLSLHSQSGLIITGSTDPVVRLWDMRSKEGSMVKEAFLGHTGWVSSLSWAPHVDHLFVSASFDNTVKMWDVRSSKAPLYEITGHEDRVLAVDWSIKSVIASGSADSTLKTYSY